MAKTYIEYPGDGVQTDFPFSFPYLKATHVYANVDGVNTAFTLNGASTAQIVPAPGDGTIVRIYRNSVEDNPLVDFTPGFLAEEDLDNAYLHTLYLAEEAVDRAAESIGFSGVFWDVQGRRLGNIAQGVEDTDAATVGQIGPFVDSASASASAAALAKAAAEAAQAAAEAARDLAEGYAASINPANFLSKSSNLSDVPDKAAALDNLDPDIVKKDVANTFTAPQRPAGANASVTGTVALDFAAAQDFVLTLTGDITLANPTGIAAGQKGRIVIINPTVYALTALGTWWKRVNDTGTPTFTARCRIDYDVADAGSGTERIEYSFGEVEV